MPHIPPAHGPNQHAGTFICAMAIMAEKQERSMSITGKIKEAAGFVKEEAFEHGKSPEAQEKAQEGRDLRNEGRMEDGKAPKTTEPGTDHPET